MIINREIRRTREKERCSHMLMRMRLSSCALFAYFAFFAVNIRAEDFSAIPAIPLPVTANWVLGLLGFLGVVFFILAGINQAKKLFSRQPPMDDEIDRLDRKIDATRARGDAARKGIYEIISADRQQYTEKLGEMKDEMNSKLEEIRAELSADGARRLEQINEQFRDIASTLGRLDERTKHPH